MHHFTPSPFPLLPLSPFPLFPHSPFPPFPLPSPPPPPIPPAPHPPIPPALQPPTSPHTHLPHSQARPQYADAVVIGLGSKSFTVLVTRLGEECRMFTDEMDGVEAAFDEEVRPR